jgi:hypothetical protein
MRHTCVLLAGGLAAILSGCTAKVQGSGEPPPAQPQPPIPSGELDTKSMVTSFSAQSDATSIHVYAALLRDSNSPQQVDPHNSGFVELDPSDSFTATIAGTTLPLALEPSPGDNHVHYTATFSAQAAATPVVISLHRGGGKADAPSSTVTVAAPFDLVTPLPATFHRGDALHIELSASPLPADGSARMTLAFVGSCVPGPLESFEYPLDVAGAGADGSIVFDTSAVAMSDEVGVGRQTTPLECDVAIHVRVDSGGKPDPAFSLGGVEGLQERVASSHIVR